MSFTLVLLGCYSIFAQASTPMPQASPPIVGIVVALAGILFAAASIWWGLRYAAQGRALEHAERMQALEAGRPLPEDVTNNPAEQFRRGAFWIAALIGGIVPLSAVIAAGWCMVEVRSAVGEPWFVFIVWSSAAAVSIAGVVSAAWLMVVAGQKISIMSSSTVTPTSTNAATRQTTAYQPQ